MERSWKNKYIDLIRTKPSYIICSDEDQLDDPDVAQLQEKIDSFPGAICEIGSGSGEHLIQQAAGNSQLLWIGLELRFKRIFRTAEKAERIGLRNLVVVRHNAKAISDLFEPQSLRGIHINFPDPWSGKRHWEKHHLLNREYLELLENLLAAGGFFSYKTDHRDRFLQICDILDKSQTMSIKKRTQDLVTSEFYSGNVKSEFERLFVRKQHPINFIYAEKV